MKINAKLQDATSPSNVAVTPFFRSARGPAEVIHLQVRSSGGKLLDDCMLYVSGKTGRLSLVRAGKESAIPLADTDEAGDKSIKPESPKK